MRPWASLHVLVIATLMACPVAGPVGVVHAAPDHSLPAVIGADAREALVVAERGRSSASLDRDSSAAGWVEGPATSSGEAGAAIELPGARYRHSAIFDPVGRRMIIFGGVGAPSAAVWTLSLGAASTWTSLSLTGNAPGLRDGHSAIYDPIRHRMIIYGGANTTWIGEIWALSLSGTPTWSLLSAAGTPPAARFLHSAIYDPVRDRMVVHGGHRNGTLNDTWALSLSGTPTWSQIVPPGSPPPIGWMHSALYDSRRDRMMVFATQGSESGVWALPLAGTSAWAALATSGPSPLPRYSTGAIYDSTGDRMVMFGGADQFYHDDTYALSLAGVPTWSIINSTTTPPSARSQHTAVLDIPRQRMIIFGGIGYVGYENDTWALPLVGTPDWILIPPVDAQPTVSDPFFAAPVTGIPASLYLGQSFTLTASVRNGGVASDDGRIAVGFPSLTSPGDAQWVASASIGDLPGYVTREVGAGIPGVDCLPRTASYLLAEYADDAWDGFNSEVNTFQLTVRPPAIGAFQVEVRSTMRTAFAGACDYVNATPPAGASALDQQGWLVARFTVTVLAAPAPGPPPAARAEHTAILDAPRDRLIVFGGSTGAGTGTGTDTDNGEVWALSFAGAPTWSLVVPSGTPPDARHGHSAIYDPLRERMLIFGGSSAGVHLADVWALSLAGQPAWTKLTPTGPPPAARFRHSAIHDPARDRMIVFAGVTVSLQLGDVWALTLTGEPAWTQLAPSGSAPFRNRSAAAYDPVRDRMLIHGGESVAGAQGDLWSLSLAGTPAWSLLRAWDPASGPISRVGHAMGYDPARDRVWLAAGVALGAPLQDVWTMALAGGNVWVERFPWGTLMPGRWHHAMVVDPSRDRLVAFGGNDALNRLNDTWFLALPEPPTWSSLGAPPPPAPPTGPFPEFTTLISPAPATLVLGQTFAVTLGARNSGLSSDDGRISVSFPSFTDPADGQWVSGTASGDLPGYVEHAAGSTLLGADCQPLTASSLVVEYADDDWQPFNNETNSATLIVQPRAVGTFVFDVRSTMRKAGGAPCEYVNALPGGGEAGHTDQQGWEVRRYTVTVVAPPPAALPVFTTAVAPVPATIIIGQTFSLSVTVRNDGAVSDDGRIVIGFPSFTGAGDAQHVSSTSTGDAPGYSERPAGSTLLGAACQPVTATHLVVEYGDSDWQWLGNESNVLTVVVQPQLPGTFYLDVRTTLRTAGAGACDYVNAVPSGGESDQIDPQGWAVRRFALTVLPAPPVPSFPSAVSFTPAVPITIGGTVRITMTVNNPGATSDDGRIVIGFPALTGPGDGQFVSSPSTGDVPGYREIAAGQTLVRSDCQPMTAAYLNVEYADDNWPGNVGGGEGNTFIVDVVPQAVGTFQVQVRSTMHILGAGPCDYVNGVPLQGTAATDQQGWAVRVINVNVNPHPPPAPLFTAAVTGIPSTIALGENFRVTASVRNDGTASNDGRISIGFPGLTSPLDGQWVASASTGDLPGYQEQLPGSVITNANCQPIGANYLVAEYVDADWTQGETNAISLVAQPTAEGTFEIEVRGTLRNSTLSAGPCDYVNSVPANGASGTFDQQGWAVRRFTVMVTAPPTPLPSPTTVWAPIVPPPGGPSGRSGATAIYHPARQALILYGGADPVYRSDVWSLPVADGSPWSAILPGGPVPQRRTLHAMIHNSVDDQLVIFGGLYSDFLNDMTVMTLSGVPWWFPNPGSGAPPSARGGHAAIYDPVRHRMLVIGGYDGALRNDVWEYAPAGVGTWRLLEVGGAPMSGRAQHAAVYDPVRDRVIVIGGDGGSFRNDVWALNLAGVANWQALSPGGTPPSGRREHTAIYDPIADRVIVYGGFDGARRGDVWALSMAGAPVWSRLYSSSVSPASRSGHTAVYDAPRRRMMIFGGDLGPGEFSREVWTLGFDQVTPVTLSLARSETTPDLVRLIWAGGDVTGLRAMVERAGGEGGPWLELGSPTVDGGDRLVFEDRSVIPGERYGYRLVVWEGSEETRLDPVWVTVPARTVVSLIGASPNPAGGDLSVAFTLAGKAAATLELFDLRGRLVASREVGTLGAGAHRVTLADARGLAAGVYLLRLSHEGRVFTAKACIVR